MENKKGNTKADELLGKLGISYKAAEAGKTTFSDLTLAARLMLNPKDSLVDRLKFWWITHRIYHFSNGDGLCFMELETGFYTPAISDPKKAGRDYYPVRKPFCSDQQ
jgi:hypothetical protein